MSAPNLPSLSSGARRVKRRRPAGPAGTSLDAIGAKVACDKLGYFSDPFVHEFGVKYSRKSPIIHRGRSTEPLPLQHVQIVHVQVTLPVTSCFETR